ncbi:MAG TPA: transposase [Pyrinomonadaceae bacterium]|nr:transposase [Pyrinomonadaceae bacterium]
MSPKFQISRDSPALYITVVAKDRLPVFKSDAIKLVTCQALDEARKSGGFLLFSYVIMPDHLHFLTDCPKSSADVLRRVKGLIARRVIDYLQEYDYQSSLAKLRHQEWKRKHSYSPLATREECVFNLQRSCLYAESGLHTPQPGASWIGRAGNRLSVVERENLAADPER